MDKQKQKLYAWERAFQRELEAKGQHFLSIQIPLDACQSFVDKVFAAYELDSPKVVKAHKNRVFACYKGWEHSIHLPEKWAQEAMTVAHEAAHGLVRRLYGFSTESHGPEFVRLYVSILVLFLGVDPDTVETSVRNSKLRVLNESIRPLAYKKPEVHKAPEASGTGFARMMAGVKTYGG